MWNTESKNLIPIISKMQCVWCKSTDMVDIQEINSGFIDVHVDGKKVKEQQLCNKCYTYIMYCHCCEKDTQAYNDVFICTLCPYEYGVVCSICDEYHSKVTDHLKK